ncbi:predicted protein [Nematostella vectensis]|uniref:Hyccin n=1 Tax=Nematostella vectensis TaxID=45351 RepID=A7S2A0_NEMVE|nr:predicted protein [Nematostella vectensis]|eukprot:XP_001634263.1 predicted protein [Nematostella vectensis]
MEFEDIQVEFKKYSEEPLKIVEKLKANREVIKGIIENLPKNYANQVSHPICSSFFELYRTGNRDAMNFVLQFVPVLIWTYLAATCRRDKQGYGELEAILLAIYNSVVMDNKGIEKTFRLPSLSRPSMYHEPSIGVSSMPALTESVLSRHEQSETPIVINGPNKQLTRISAGYRMSVLCTVLSQYNSSIALMNEDSHTSYCIMAHRIAKAGFSKLCRKDSTDCNGFLSNEELQSLSNHPRVPIVAPLIQEITHGLYYLLYNGQPDIAKTALEQLDFRVAHGLLAPAHVLTNAVVHSQSITDAAPKEGPLGLQVLIPSADTQIVTPSPTMKTLKLPEFLESSSSLHAWNDRKTLQTDE